MTTYEATVTPDLKIPNTNVKSWDDVRRAIQLIMENFRSLEARVTVDVDVGHPHTWTGASYTPTLTASLWEGHSAPPAARNPTLGSGGSINGYSWSLFGWTYATGHIHWGTATSRDTGYGKWVVTLPSAPYNMGRAWIGQATLKQQNASGSLGGYVSGDTFVYSAVAASGASSISFFSDNSVGPVAVCGLGLGGTNTSSDNDDINVGQGLTYNALLTWEIWYRTEA